MIRRSVTIAGKTTRRANKSFRRRRVASNALRGIRIDHAAVSLAVQRNMGGANESQENADDKRGQNPYGQLLPLAEDGDRKQRICTSDCKWQEGPTIRRGGWPISK